MEKTRAFTRGVAQSTGGKNCRRKKLKMQIYASPGAFRFDASQYV